MSDPEVASRMREDWNARAREDAGFYVAFGRRNSGEAEFFDTATQVVKRLEWELSRVPFDRRRDWRALEIGCGPGRLMRPLSRYFAEIHGVDVSDEMIALAREKLRDIPNAYLHVTDGSSLAQFKDESFELVFSYAVFQHVPSRDVVFEYLRETERVLKPDGFALLHFSGLVRRMAGIDTWDGVRFSSSEILDFARLHDFQVLALEGIGTQYMWTIWRKRPAGWQTAQDSRKHEAAVRIRRITNTNSSEPVAPSRGLFASISIWVEDLPAEAGLHDLQVAVGASFGTVCYIGPPDQAGLQQVNVMLPDLEATGLLPVEMHWLGRRISPPVTLRVIPPGPSVPRIRFITDGVNLSAGTRIETRSVKVTLEEIARPEEMEASIDGYPVRDLEFFCTDPRPQRFEVNFLLPEEIGPGPHQLTVRIGRRKLAPVTIEVMGR